MASCPIVVLGPLTIDSLTPDGDGTVWDATLLDGWWDTPDNRLTYGDVMPMGQTVTVARFEGRSIAAQFLARHANGHSPLGANCFRAIDRFKRAFAATLVPVLMTVTDAVETRQSLARLSSKMKVAIGGELGYVQFQVPILCPDPRRYAPTVNTGAVNIAGAGTDSGGVVITNAGDLSTPPVVTIHGPAVQPLIQNDSLDDTPNVKWVGTLGGADILVIDMAAETMRFNGANAINGLDPASRFWQLAPGANVIHYHRNSGSGAAASSVAWQDAYQ